MRGALRGAAAAWWTLAVCAQPAIADEVADFYRGKTFTIVVANEVGTGFDIYGRTLGRHLGRHIPGDPNIVIQNMVGASGLPAANWLYNVAPKDGTAMATFVSTVPFEPLLGNSAAKYDADKFTWVGNMDIMASMCGVSRAAGVQTFDDLLKRETIFGATGATGPIATHALGLKHMFDAKIKLVPGYKGSGSLKIAIQRGEISGVCLDMSTITALWKDDLDSGAFKPLIQTSGGPHPLLAGIPNVNEFAKTNDDRLAIGLVFGTDDVGRPFAAPPGVPAARAQALREAFVATMADPAFLADAGKQQIHTSMMSGEDVTAFIARLSAAPADVIERVKQAIRND